jgi:hypothetical protein
VVLEVREAGAAILAGAVTSQRDVVQRPRAALNGFGHVSLGDASADANDHQCPPEPEGTVPILKIVFKHFFREDEA